MGDSTWSKTVLVDEKQDGIATGTEATVALEEVIKLSGEKS